MKSTYNLLYFRHGFLALGIFAFVLILRQDVEATESVNMLSEKQQQSTPETEISTQNPHWKSTGCQACHKDKPGRNNLKLHTTDINVLCNSCHSKISEHSYIHPFGMVPSRKIVKNMPGAFSKAVKRGGGQLTCITCHDLTMTCLPEKKSIQDLNPLFFREGPYGTRTELCYRCHDKSKYRRFNPHDQINDVGELKMKQCSVCHVSTDKLQTAKNINEVDFYHQENLSAMCTGCHPVKPHPGGSFSFFSDKKGPNHLVIPPEKMLQHMLKMQQKNNVVLPLEPGSGKLFCGTCHNPHEKGVIKVAAAARGADGPKRLRMQKICTNCHDK